MEDASTKEFEAGTPVHGPLQHLLDAMLWPLGFQNSDRYNPAMPPGRLSTHVWVEGDAEANIGRAAAQFARWLGKRPIENRYNTRHVEWRWGAASITLTSWPPALQSAPKLSIPAHCRDTRLITACSVSIETGWRTAVSVREVASLNRFVTVGPTRDWTPTRPRAGFGQGQFAETLLEFMREPPADLDRFRNAFGLSADGAALITCEQALYLVPLEQVKGFKVSRTLPAKGGGSSTLFAVCNTGYAARSTKDVPVAQGTHADDLNDITGKLAAATGKPLELEAYGYDA